MRRATASVLLLFLLFVPTPARAERGTIVVLYARVLHAFNAQLDSDEAMSLAHGVIAEADAQGLDARLLVALIAVESSWRPQAISPVGAMGLGQLMPGTASELGVDPDDPQANIHGAAVYLRALLNRYAGYDRSTQYVDALAAYNAGAGAVTLYGGVPPYPQTQRYVRAVLALWRRLAGAP